MHNSKSTPLSEQDMERMQKLGITHYLVDNFLYRG
jgi:hypothetical protein